MKRMAQFRIGACFLAITLAAAVVGTAFASAAADYDYSYPEYHVPQLTIDELLSLSTSSSTSSSSNVWNRFRDALSTTGLLAIDLSAAIFAMNLQSIRETAFAGLCDCTAAAAKDSPFVDVSNNNQHALLRDVVPPSLGVFSLDPENPETTTRTTIATATVGLSHPLKLPVQELSQVCGTETLHAMEDLREAVSHVSQAFIKALDAQHNIVLPSAGATKHKYTSMESIVEDATHLEHFHVYHRKQQHYDNTMVLDVHTDAGLFLSFVPGETCPDGKTKTKNDTNHFYVELHNNVLHRAVFPSPETSVVLMMGHGAQHWLQHHLSTSSSQQSFKLQATRHAVQMAPNTRRVWYGMMHLVPLDAIVQQVPVQATFADMKRAMGSTTTAGAATSNDISIGCGAATPLFFNSSSSLQHQTSRRRRLQMVADGSVCNNITNFYCWMSCLDIPDVDNAKDRLDQGESLYCLDPSLVNDYDLAGSIEEAETVCEGNGVPGGAMRTACKGSWQTTVPGVPSTPVITNQTLIETLQANGEPFCYGGTSMYMDGFHWRDMNCIIYLFPSWILSSQGLVVAACVGTVLFGILVEFVIHSRPMLLKRYTTGGWDRLLFSTLLYGLQITMGYWIMLIVMTYHGPLFMSVVLGLMSGHFLVNMKSQLGGAGEQQQQAKQTKEAAAALEHADGQEDNVSAGTSLECGCAATPEQKKAPKETFPIPVPEGSTPCCRHS